ncbi:hypothetical protein Agub_g9230 [Astrephomene gubernaculifera]|uniref:Glycosyltransferase n=1 Tax=Astrephomene gubernaculifera TaxID=47775 RepID=A0AAD3DT22_9CHLO|nr:hypothetical protein Agub_g9230 [Astrephomene gubernaculifera]
MQRRNARGSLRRPTHLSPLTPIRSSTLLARVPFRLLLLLPALLLSLSLSLQPASAQNAVAQLARSHFAPYGMRLPSRQFTAALRAAALDTTALSCPGARSHSSSSSSSSTGSSNSRSSSRSLVLLAMANEEAMTHTVPPFLLSMRRVRLSYPYPQQQRPGAAVAAAAEAGVGRQQTEEEEGSGVGLDGALVLVGWSAGAVAACRALQAEFRHQCVRDAEHAAAAALGGSFGFHDSGFNSLGFAKIKYILNGLSAGHDVVFLDTDLLLLRDPLPYLLGQGGDMYGAMEKCMVVNASLHLHAREYVAGGRKAPPLNIGVLYFKATAGVTRCVYNWAREMQSEVQQRPRVWDQDIYGKVMGRCTAIQGLRWHLLDPRVFQSGCFPGCGCSFRDEEVTPARLGAFSRGHRLLPGGLCGPQHWGSWLLRHFPCSGLTREKGELMRGLLDGYYSNHTARITKPSRAKIGRL